MELLPGRLLREHLLQLSFAAARRLADPHDPDQPARPARDQQRAPDDVLRQPARVLRRQRDQCPEGSGRAGRAGQRPVDLAAVRLCLRACRHPGEWRQARAGDLPERRNAAEHRVGRVLQRRRRNRHDRLRQRLRSPRERKRAQRRVVARRVADRLARRPGSEGRRRAGPAMAGCRTLHVHVAAGPHQRRRGQGQPRFEDQRLPDDGRPELRRRRRRGDPRGARCGARERRRRRRRRRRPRARGRLRSPPDSS